MIVKKGKGLSPVIATVLLVAIVLILAIIIFFWARNFVSNAIEKGGRTIELSCEEVGFRVEAYDDKIYIENIASVPIYGIEVREKKAFGEIRAAEVLENSIDAGETSEIELPEGLEVGDELVIAPILLGETDRYKKTYVCDEDYGQEISVVE